MIILHSNITKCESDVAKGEGEPDNLSTTIAQMEERVVNEEAFPGTEGRTDDSTRCDSAGENRRRSRKTNVKESSANDEETDSAQTERTDDPASCDSEGEDRMSGCKITMGESRGKDEMNDNSGDETSYDIDRGGIGTSDSDEDETVRCQRGECDGEAIDIRSHHTPTIEELMAVFNSPHYTEYVRETLGDKSVDECMLEEEEWADKVLAVYNNCRYRRLVRQEENIEVLDKSTTKKDGFVSFQEDPSEGHAYPTAHTTHDTISEKMSLCVRRYVARGVQFERYNGDSITRLVRLLGRDPSCETEGNEGYITYGDHIKPYWATRAIYDDDPVPAFLFAYDDFMTHITNQWLKTHNTGGLPWQITMPINRFLLLTIGDSYGWHFDSQLNLFCPGCGCVPHDRSGICVPTLCLGLNLGDMFKHPSGRNGSLRLGVLTEQEDDEDDSSIVVRSESLPTYSNTRHLMPHGGQAAKYRHMALEAVRFQGEDSINKRVIGSYRNVVTGRNNTVLRYPSDTRAHIRSLLASADRRIERIDDNGGTAATLLGRGGCNVGFAEETQVEAGVGKKRNAYQTYSLTGPYPTALVRQTKTIGLGGFAWERVLSLENFVYLRKKGCAGIVVRVVGKKGRPKNHVYGLPTINNKLVQPGESYQRQELEAVLNMKHRKRGNNTWNQDFPFAIQLPRRYKNGVEIRSENTVSDILEGGTVSVTAKGGSISASGTFGNDSKGAADVTSAEPTKLTRDNTALMDVYLKRRGCTIVRPCPVNPSSHLQVIGWLRAVSLDSVSTDELYLDAARSKVAEEKR